MEKSWKDFRSKLVERPLGVLWSQWEAVGVGSTATSETRRYSVDLEAMLVGTWSIGRVDPRLFDAALHWCRTFADLVSTKRLDALLDRLDDDPLRRIAAGWGRHVEKHGSASWQAGLEGDVDGAAGNPLFVSRQLDDRATPPERDEIFEQVGWARPPLGASSTKPSLRLDSVATLQLYCRKLFGIGARAETVATLLTAQTGAAQTGLATAELAESTLYSRRTIQTILGDLRDAGAIRWNPGRGRSTRASPNPDFRSGLVAPFSDADTVPLVSRKWPGHYAALHALWSAAREVQRRGDTDFKARSLLRDGLETGYQHLTPTPFHPVYEPRLSNDSLETLLTEANRFLDSLFPEETSHPTAQQS